MASSNRSPQRVARIYQLLRKLIQFRSVLGSPSWVHCSTFPPLISQTTESIFLPWSLLKLTIWVFPKLTYMVFFFFFWLVWHCRILFPDQGLNPHPLQWEHRAFNHWTTRKVPYMAFFEFYFLNLNVVNQPNKNTSTIPQWSQRWRNKGISD